MSPGSKPSEKPCQMLVFTGLLGMHGSENDPASSAVLSRQAFMIVEGRNLHSLFEISIVYDLSTTSQYVSN